MVKKWRDRLPYAISENKRDPDASTTKRLSQPVVAEHSGDCSGMFRREGNSVR